MVVAFIRCLRSERGRPRRVWVGAGRCRRARCRARRWRGSRRPGGAVPSSTGTATRRAGTSRCGCSVPSGARISATALRSSPCCTLISMTSLAGLRLQLGRRAGGDRSAVVDDDDVVGQLVGLLEVLRRQQDVGTAGDERADRFPQVDAGARVQTGRRLVEQQQPWRADQAGAQVELAAHAARVALHRPVGVLGQVDLAAAPRRPRRERRAWGGRTGEPIITRFSRPVSAGSTAAFWPARPMTRRTSSGRPVGVDARHVQRPAVGLQQRGHRLDEGGLAGTVRTEDRGHLAGWGDQVETGQRMHVAVVLGQADRLDRGRGAGGRSGCHATSVPDETGHGVTCFLSGLPAPSDSGRHGGLTGAGGEQALAPRFGSGADCDGSIRRRWQARSTRPS